MPQWCSRVKHREEEVKLKSWLKKLKRTSWVTTTSKQCKDFSRWSKMFYKQENKHRWLKIHPNSSMSVSRKAWSDLELMASIYPSVKKKETSSRRSKPLLRNIEFWFDLVCSFINKLKCYSHVIYHVLLFAGSLVYLLIHLNTTTLPRCATLMY